MESLQITRCLPQPSWPPGFPKPVFPWLGRDLSGGFVRGESSVLEVRTTRSVPVGSHPGAPGLAKFCCSTRNQNTFRRKLGNFAMTMARRYSVDSTVTPYYHCIPGVCGGPTVESQRAKQQEVLASSVRTAYAQTRSEGSGQSRTLGRIHYDAFVAQTESNSSGTVIGCFCRWVIESCWR